MSRLLVRLGALALRKQVVEPVGQIEDSKNEWEDETRYDIDSLGPRRKLGQYVVAATAIDHWPQPIEAPGEGGVGWQWWHAEDWHSTWKGTGAERNTGRKVRKAAGMELAASNALVT